VASLAEVEQARVHLTFPKDSVFLDAQQPAKASVLVKTRPGAALSKQNVVAINHLVASAVEGLSPDAVSVLDMNGNLLGRPKPAPTADGSEASEASLEYRRKIESDLLAKVNSTLEPLLGANKFRASVSVECNFSGSEQSEEVFDPTRSVMVSSQRTEDATGGPRTSGVPGTASTLPRPTSRPASNSKGLSRVTENITYQTSRTVRKTRLPAGEIRRMSLAVLVDQGVSWEPIPSGLRRVLVPPSPEKLKVIRDVVSGIAGFSTERGDQLVVETLPFETTLLMEPPASGIAAPVPETPKRVTLPAMQWTPKALGIAAGTVLTLMALAGAALGLLRRRKRVKPGEPAAPVELPAGTPDGAPPAVEAPSGSGEDDIEAKIAQREALERKLELQALGALRLTPVITKTAEVLAKHLREKISKDPEVSAQVLRTWIRDE